MPDAGSLPGRARHACVVATQVPGRTQLQPRTRGVLVKWFSVPKHMSLCCRPQVFPGAAGSEPQLQPQHRPRLAGAAWGWGVVDVRGSSGRRRPPSSQPRLVTSRTPASRDTARPHAHTGPALPLVQGALPTALCTLMTSKHFHSRPPGGQASGSARAKAGQETG